MLAYIQSDDCLTFFLDNTQYQVRADNAFYKDFLRACGKQDRAKLEELLDCLKDFDKRVERSVKVINGELIVDGVAFGGSISDRIKKMYQDGHSVAGLINFVKKVLRNPDKDSRDSIFDFLTKNGMPITEDGDFIGYKYVTGEFKDCHTQTFDNSPGSVCKIDRLKVNPDRSACSSYGLHIGTYEFVKDHSTIVCCLINPEHVVSVPIGDEHKVRVCEYTVIGQYGDEKPVDDGVYYVPKTGPKSAASFEKAAAPKKVAKPLKRGKK